MKKAMHAKPFRLHAPGHKARHARPESPRTRVVRAVSLCLACICLLVTATVYPASAATGSSSMSSLQNKLNKLSQSIKLHEQELNNAKKKEAAAKALESELKERVSVIQDQISVLSGQIASVQNSIGQKEQEISAKETEIAEKETEIEAKELEIQDQWSDFKKHMAAMQELRDGGSVAMLSAVNDLYELLTFNEVMQDISVKDTEIMDNMKTAKAGLEADKTALESDRAELVSQKADLQSQKNELDSQNSQMQSKQSELNSSISAAQMSAADAKKAQAAAQAAIESDELNYEAVKSQIQKLIAQAASSQPQLSFTGFICPLKSYSRISSEYGWRKNPVSGVNKLHAGIDLAAGGGTPIYAAASGYVQVAGWRLRQLCHHLPRQNVRRQHLQHPVRPYEVGGHQCRQVRQAGRAHRLCGQHRQFHRQPPASGGVEGRQQGQRRQPPRLHPVPAQLIHREGVWFL